MRGSVRAVTWWQGAALLAMAGTLVFGAVRSWDLVRAVFVAGGEPVDTDLGEAREAFESDLAVSVARVEGRSLFWEPPRAPEPPPPVVVVERPPPGPTPPPSRYAGPAITAMVNGKVWFSNGDRIGVDEEKGGVQVLSISAPWSARVRWREAEFDVPLFQADERLVRTGAAPDEDADADTDAPGSGLGAGDIDEDADLTTNGSDDDEDTGGTGMDDDGATLVAPAVDREEGSSDEL